MINLKLKKIKNWKYIVTIIIIKYSINKHIKLAINYI